MQKFMKILLRFDEILTKIDEISLEVSAGCAGWVSRNWCIATFSPDAGRDTSLFPRLVLGWIEADFRVQIRIFQHFSKSTRKPSSREQIRQIIAKKLQTTAKMLTLFGNFCKNYAKFSEIRKKL